jgi:hypothetical protein
LATAKALDERPHIRFSDAGITVTTSAVFERYETAYFIQREA